ncbi:cobalt transport protein [Eubacterium brachy ATCC 33089]|nr:cobalt transport protein [Eubacterium brachy ATCC 33089]
MLIKNESFNPTPITKLVVLVALGMSILSPMSFKTLKFYTVNDIFNLLIVVTFSVFYALNGFVKQGLKTFLTYFILININYIFNLKSNNYVLNMFFTLIVIVKFFFLPFMAGKFLIRTSDVGSILTSMDKIKIPKVVSIPIAVMFRFFPSFKEERRNIKLAMRIRGVTPKNPLKYLEYVAIPVITISLNIADDISKSAETKCIAMPCQKVRYNEVKPGLADIVFLSIIVLIEIGGRLCWR